MKGRIVVHLRAQGTWDQLVEIKGMTYEFDPEAVRKTVQQLIEAVGQGSFVIQQDEGTWAVIPTSSILYTTIETENADA